MDNFFETFKGYIQNLAKTLNIQNIEIDANNDCYLVFDNKYYVKCSYLADLNQIRFFAFLGIIPDDKVEYYQDLLERNHFWKDTAGANLSIDPQDGTLVLSHYKDMRFINNDIFFKTLENFVNAMEHWDAKCLQEWYQTPLNASNTSNEPDKVAGMFMLGA